MAQAATKGGTAKQLKRARKNVGKALTNDSLKAFAKLTALVDGEPRIASDQPTITPIEEVAGDAAPGRTTGSQQWGVSVGKIIPSG